MLLLNAHKNSEGFTLLENLIVVTIIGILAAISAPSFMGMYNRSKVNDALNTTRGALQEVQTEAIRRSQTCKVALTTASQPLLSSNCFTSVDNSITTSGVANNGATNINVNSLPVAIPSGTALVFTGGTIAVLTAPADQGATSLTVSAIPAQIPSGEVASLRTLPKQVAMKTDIDSTGVAFSYQGTATLGTSGTGKIVFFPSDGSSTQKCIAISTPLGLLRAGEYSGATASAANITAGTCTTKR